MLIKFDFKGQTNFLVFLLASTRYKTHFLQRWKKVEKQSDQSNAQLLSFFSLAETMALPRATYNKEYAYTCYYRIIQRVGSKIHKHFLLH